MPKWDVCYVRPDMANHMQFNAGIMVEGSLDLSNVEKTVLESTLFETTGDFHVTCKPTISDRFADVNNCPKGTMEGARIDEYVSECTTTVVSITNETLKMSMGAAEDVISPAAGVTPRRQLTSTDFKSITWLGDMGADDKLFAIKMENCINIGGFDFTAKDNGNGTLAMTIKPHPSLASQNKIPVSCFILTKKGVE